MSSKYLNYSQRYELLKESIYKHIDPTTRLKIFQEYEKLLDMINKAKEQD